MEPHLVARLIAQPVRVAVEAAVPGARQAILIRPDHPYLTTEEFLAAIDSELKKRM